MMHKSWQRWTILAFFLSLSLYTLDRAWSQQKEASKTLTSEERMKRDIEFLASDVCEGRGPGTKGIELAADYIAGQFKEAGLKPGGVNGTWFQPFAIGGLAKVEGDTVLKLQGPNKKVIELKLGDDFQVLGNSGSGKISAPLVFAGYGLAVKDKDINFDEFKNLDVKGKVVVLIRRVPRWNDKEKPFAGNRETYASLNPKFARAEEYGAAAILLINDTSVEDDKLIAFKQFAQEAPRPIPAINIHRDAIDPVFQSGLKKSLGDIEKAIDADLKPLSGPIAGWSATISCTVSRPPVKNVVGVLEGAGPLADETVVVGAHYDHLGYGDAGSKDPKSKKRAEDAGNPALSIHHGADDNASGTTTVMELARRFAAMPKRQGRRIVFMTFSAEERGLLGSVHYCKEPLFPLDKTVAMVNLDMVGRLAKDKDNKGGELTVEGIGSGKGFDELIDKLNESAGFKIIKEKKVIPYSDHYSFYVKKVPVIFFFSGFHKEYHTPKDTADLINIPGMKRIADLSETAIAHFATEPKRPEFVGTISKNPKDDLKKPVGPKLGIKPDDYDGKDGVKVGMVSEGGVAAAAGVKNGDIIVEIAGQQVKNIQSYIEIMNNQKIGQSIEIVVMRENNRVVLKAALK